MARNLLGLIAENFWRHCTAKHNGAFDPVCDKCNAHESIMNEHGAEISSNWQRMSGTSILRSVNWSHDQR